MTNRNEEGLTLLELLVTLAVAAIVTALAVPSFGNISARNRLAVTTNQLLSGMHVARNLAVSRNVSVTFCAGRPDEGCHGDWSKGEWIVFVDRHPLGEFGSGDDLHVSDSTELRGGLMLAANGPFNRAVVFRPSGAARWPSGAFAAGRLRICAERGISPNANELVLIGSGRAVSQSCDLGGLCPGLSATDGRCQ